MPKNALRFKLLRYTGQMNTVKLLSRNANLVFGRIATALHRLIFSWSQTITSNGPKKCGHVKIIFVNSKFMNFLPTR